MERTLAPRGSHPIVTIARYGAAVFSVAAGVLLSMWLQSVLDPMVPLLVTVLLAAWFTGLWPALGASVLATLAIDFFFEPPLYTLTLELSHIPHLVVFVLLATLFASASSARRKAEQSLRQARDELEIRVRERTAALQRTNEQLQDEIVERRRAEEALEELAGRLINAQEQERSRIGRELHDHISQLLGVLMIKIDQLRAHPATPAAMENALNDVRHCASDITDDVHRLSHRLHSSTLDYLGLVPALQKLVAEFTDHHDVPVEFAHTSLPTPVPADVALCLFRVTEESLNNVARHSHAKAARVDVRGALDGIHLTVRDDGKGFDTTQLQSRAGLGFVSMQERLRLLRGTVRIDSAPSHGTTVNVWIPSEQISDHAAGETRKPPSQQTASDISAA
ncbi:MAG: sensor histidine kinase [Vicinamibacterales bacterium]